MLGDLKNFEDAKSKFCAKYYIFRVRALTVLSSHVDVETHITITEVQLTQDNSSQYQVLLPAELRSQTFTALPCQTGVILSRLTALDTTLAVAAAAAVLKFPRITGLRLRDFCNF